MTDALFDINADGMNQGFDATPSQALTLRLRNRPSSANTVQFQVWDATRFDSSKTPAGNPPRKSKGAPNLSLVGASTGTLVAPAGGVDGTASVTMPSDRGWAWIVRCLVDGGQTVLPNGQVVPDNSKIHERMIVVRDGNGARAIIATETTQYEDDGWAGAFLAITSGVPGATGPAGESGRSVRMPFKFSSETADIDPGAGFLRLNGSESEQDSTLLRVSLIDAQGDVVSATLDTAARRRGNIRLMSVADPSKWIAFSVSALASPTGYRNFTIALIVSGNTVPASPYNPFADGDALLLCFDDAGVLHVEEFGAVPIYLGADQDQVNVPLRTANKAALQAAFDLARALKCELQAGPGIYLTNGAVGYNLTTDENIGVKFRGLGEFTMLRSNNNAEPVIWLMTTGGNLREITIEDIVIRGGREGLAMVWVAYSQFNRVWFWGSKQWALQNEAGNGNMFHQCRTNESAQGIGDGTEADAVLFVSCEDTLSMCNFGEFSGGILINGGVCTIDDGCIFHDCSYRGQNYHSYIDNVLVDISGTFLPITASIIVWQGSAVIKGAHGNFIHRFLTTFRAYDVLVAGSRLQTIVDDGIPFTGFIDVVTATGTVLALNVAASSFVFIGNKTGFLVRDADDVLHDARLEAQVSIYAGSTMTALSSSAPKLLNPGSENNHVSLSTFNR